ncbi:MAG TPA: NADPH-dependent assimilatory sulfite reductase hemoprotein subunit [Chthoniobacterales bacterium]|nr:NADPH-dependent assimilatory sulfite reductase hemoprotein subunit [Chthoniobacterales bacterium]
MPAKNVEQIKAESRSLRGKIAETLQHEEQSHFADEEFQLLKFHGTYQQDDRDKRVSRKQQNLDKAWIFMVRSKLPGGALTAAQYLAHDQIAGELGNGTLRITTRQGFQTHGVLKGHLQECIRRINESGVTTLGACGDVVRNTIAPAAPIDDQPHRDAQRLAKEISDTFLAKTSAYAEIWLNGERLEASTTESEPIYGTQYLPRKFKIAIAIPPRNDVDVYSNDLGFIAHVEAGETKGYTIVVGGGFGMTHGKMDTYPALAQALGYVERPRVIEVAKAVVTAQRDYGNRTDRKRARLKYLLEERGIEWFRHEVRSRLTFDLEPPKSVKWSTVGDLLGWHEQGNGKLFYGVWVEEGRIQDSRKAAFRSAFREIAERLQLSVRLTTNCNLIFHDIEPSQKSEFEAILVKHRIPHLSKLSETRKLAHACVALPTCGLALAESERVFPDVLAEIDKILDDLSLSKEPILIRMTGCPNGCARPYNADIAFVGRAPGKYAMFVGGSISGDRLVGLEEKSIHQSEIPAKVRELLEDFVQNRFDGEPFSFYWGRTRVNGPAPRPEQFHQELKNRESKILAPV